MVVNNEKHAMHIGGEIYQHRWLVEESTANQNTCSIYDREILLQYPAVFDQRERGTAYFLTFRESLRETLLWLYRFARKQIMSETRKILVALDGSKHSEYALNCEYFLHLCGLPWGEGGRECRESTITGTHNIYIYMK